MTHKYLGVVWHFYGGKEIKSYEYTFNVPTPLSAVKSIVSAAYQQDTMFGSLKHMRDVQVKIEVIKLD